MWGDPKTLGQVCGAAEPWLWGSRDGALRAEVQQGARMGQSCAPCSPHHEGNCPADPTGFGGEGEGKKLKKLE